MAAEEDDPDYNTLRNVVLPDAKKQPDRYLAIVMAAVIDEQLNDLLQSRLAAHRKVAKKLFGGVGPLATFSARIDLGLLLGLYDEGFAKMLHSIRDIRNTFAHNTYPLSLASPEVQQKAAGLNFMKEFDNRPKKWGERELFIAACEGSLGGLAALAMDKRRLRPPIPGKGPSHRFFKEK
jgi:hypothetical protein